MPKNIVICCDGTNNQFSSSHTNVIRAYKVASRSSHQITYYDCGVGTMPQPWKTGLLAQRWAMIEGLAFGSGFLENIQSAYYFLMNNYEPGDRIYLFGFSRGAFTVRALAGMLYSVGLLHKGADKLIRYAQKYWQKDFRPESAGQKLCEEFKSTLSRSCPVHFIGVWDTVSSVGVINQFRTFPFTFTNPEVLHIRHAVSLDERRSCFRQNLFMKAHDNQDVKNVWFPGVHSDVGGGYHPLESGLAKVAFEWMMREAGECGLQIDKAALNHELTGAGAVPDPCADQHESLQGGWRWVELIPVRRYIWATGSHRWYLPLGKARNAQREALKPEVFLHQSVIARLEHRTDYRPKNIPHDEFELRKIFKIEN